VTRLPVAAFVALAVATVGAFFVTQALKVTTPLINGFPAPVPSTINPVSGGTCRVRGPKGKLVRVGFRAMRISFYLQNRGDVVDVSIVDSAGNIVAELPGSGRYLRTGHRRQFTWNGRQSNGRVAPDGAYDIRVRLVQQDRQLTISDSSGRAEPVTVMTRPPQLSITGVSPHVLPSAAAKATIRFADNSGLRPRVLILRISRRGRPRVVKTYAATAVDGHTLWNGTLTGGRPAPPGSYLVALRLTDRTCNTVSTPQTATAGARSVITVR
jgi:flagellar hook assembly protein FlgD